MTNFNTMRARTLGTERNAITDNVDDGGASQRVAARRAMEWQRELGEKIPSGDKLRLTSFTGPNDTGPVRELKWNPSDGVPAPYDPIDDVTPAEWDAIYGDYSSSQARVPDGAKDAAPSVLSFYAGKSFAEGRKAHNEYRASQGLSKIPEGRK